MNMHIPKASLLILWFASINLSSTPFRPECDRIAGIFRQLNSVNT